MTGCAVCEKAAHFRSNVSHPHRRGDRIWKTNVKSVKIKIEDGVRKMYICTSCFRSNSVERA